MNKEKFNKLFIKFSIIAMIILLILGIKTSYDIGQYEGVKKICGEYSFGLDENEQLICHDKGTPLYLNHNQEYNIKELG